MTQISNDDVQYLAQLSSLELSESEVQTLLADIPSILGYVELLSELDTNGVEPTYQVTDLQNVWRDDVVDTYGLERDALLAIAPEQLAHQIKVPKVL